MFRIKKRTANKGWWENGKPVFYQFYNDEYQGEVQEWYFSGQLFKRFHYEKAKKKGERLWFEDGSVRANYVIKKKAKKWFDRN
jgi:antitoxin component YwqK of YwqJK toxin-antitoxin module